MGGPHLFIVVLKPREGWLVYPAVFPALCTPGCPLRQPRHLLALNGIRRRNELKGLVILNLITLLCSSAAFTLDAFLWRSTFRFLINHLLTHLFAAVTLVLVTAVGRVAPATSFAAQTSFLLFPRVFLATHGCSVCYLATSASRGRFTEPVGIGKIPNGKCASTRDQPA